MMASRIQSAPGQNLDLAMEPNIVHLIHGATVPMHLVGGKGAGLARLAAKGLPVPPAFAITTCAFQRFCRFNGLSIDDPRCADALVAGVWPPELHDDIEKALAALHGRLFAVRSSAPAEDGAQFSMAGQLETLLKVPRAQVFRHILLCWASLFSRRIESYWRRMPNAVRQMAVVVQEQIEPAWSGVAFSIEPLSNSCDDLVIEWTEGLGDKLVGGQIVPERLVLARSHAVIPESVPARLRERLTELHQHVLAAEVAFECPVDTEWCATMDKLWMLQARPITTMHGKDHVLWSNVNLAENFPNPLAPLAWSFIARFYQEYMCSTLRLCGWTEHEFSAVPHLLKQLTGLHQGRIYYNLTSWYGLISYFPRSAAFRGFLDTYIGQQVPIRIDPDLRAPELRRRQQGLWGTARFFLNLVASFARTGKALEGLERSVEHERRKWRRVVSEAQDPRELLELVDEILGVVASRWQGPCGADLMVMVMPGLLKVLLARWCGQGATQALPRLLQGVSVKSDEPTRLLWQTSQIISRSEAGRAGLAVSEYATSREQIPAEARALFNEFLQRFGARCYNDCSLISPTFEEEPELAWQLVLRFADVPDRFSAKAKGPLIADREALLAELCHGLKPWQARALRLVVRMSLRAIQHRESGRLLQSLLFGEVRGAFLRLGELLASLGMLPDAEDVFYCTLADLADLARGAYSNRETLAQLLAERKARVASAHVESAPTLFVLPVGEVWGTREHPAAPEGTGSTTLHGVAVSRGKVRGVARVVRDPTQDGAPNAGDILIAPSTDPGWTPLFLLAGGLILERGGLLSHGAIIAREMGIPALVEVKNACRLIKDGATLFLDADAGTVRME